MEPQGAQRLRVGELIAQVRQRPDRVAIAVMTVEQSTCVLVRHAVEQARRRAEGARERDAQFAERAALRRRVIILAVAAGRKRKGALPRARWLQRAKADSAAAEAGGLRPE